MDLKQLSKTLTEEQFQELLKLRNEPDIAEHDETHCTHCGHPEPVKNGKTKNKTQRYRCKGCKKVFTQKTNTVQHYSKKSPALWARYVDLMFQGKSIRKIAKELGISVTTAFYWRHKILNIFKNNYKPKLKSVVEADETYFRLSYKGQKKNFPKRRKPRKRGWIHKRGISKEQVCVLTATDRLELATYMRPLCLGNIKLQGLRDHLLGHVYIDGLVLVTDGARAYKAFADENGILHTRIGTARKKGKHHVQTVNALHSNLKGFMYPFKGVATKYLDNYLSFFQWQNMERDAVLAKEQGFVTWEELRTRKMDLK